MSAGSVLPVSHVTPESARQDSHAILFYDGTCGFCATSVQFILNHEGPRKWLRFATLQGALAASLRGRHPQLNDVDSVVWFEPATETRKERVLVRSSAGLAAARYMGGIWKVLAWIGWCVPRPLRDVVYRLVARNRHRLVRNDTCLLPTPEQRARFIE
jgi:predicted DCC family thiol-disulfide oxidoreductase YuxK